MGWKVEKGPSRTTYSAEYVDNLVAQYKERLDKLELENRDLKDQVKELETLKKYWPPHKRR